MTTFQTKRVGSEAEPGHSKPQWLSRLDKTMSSLYKDVDRMKKFNRLNERKRTVLRKKYQLNQENLPEILESCTQKLSALKARKERYINRINRKKQNKDFLHNRKRLFNEILGEGKNSDSSPDPQLCEQFWKSIWSNDDPHESMDWIVEKVSELHSQKETQADSVITLNELKDQFRKTPNWKAPGMDGLHPFWLKNLTTLHPRIVELLNDGLQTGLEPMFTTGRTVLIQKDKLKGNSPSNFRPITCLPIVWKTMTGILGRKIYAHLEKNKMIPSAQKGCIRNTRATKDQLLIDRAIVEDARKKQKNLSICWIDFQKAFDMVPHSWIIQTLRMYKVSEVLVKFLSESMKKWNLWLFCRNTKLCNITVKRGIFQGDSLSPLLFIMSLFPLSEVVLKKSWGYQIKPSVVINHLLYMDDLKLYAKNEEQLHRMIAEVKHFTDRMKMQFGTEKCKIVHIVRGKLKTNSSPFPISQQDCIETLVNKDEQYKYLGILQLDQIKHAEMKIQIKREYFKRVRAILQTQLSGKHKILSINSLAIPVVRYSGGIIQWSQAELAEVDTKTRKLLTCHRGFAKLSDVDRLYVDRKDGGRGLISAADCIQLEEASIGMYRETNSIQFFKYSGLEQSKKSLIRQKSKKREKKNGWLKQCMVST
jgi:hypothetical protein